MAKSPRRGRGRAQTRTPLGPRSAASARRPLWPSLDRLLRAGIAATAVLERSGIFPRAQRERNPTDSVFLLAPQPPLGCRPVALLSADGRPGNRGPHPTIPTQAPPCSSAPSRLPSSRPAPVAAFLRARVFRRRQTSALLGKARKPYWMNGV